MPGPYHYLPLPSRQTCGRRNLHFLEKKGSRENNDMEPYGSLLLTGGWRCTKCQITHAKNKKHEIDKMCGEHELYLCTGSAPGFVQRITCNSGKTCTKGGCGTGSGNRALRVKLTKMVNVPGVAHRNAIFGLKADSATPSDSFHPVRAFPLRRQLVGILGGLNAPKNKVAFLETSGVNFAAMVAAQSLLVASSSHSSPKTAFLKEQRVIFSQLLLLKLIISEHSSSHVYEFRRDN